MVAVLVLGLFFLGLFIVSVLRLVTSRRLRTAQRLADIDDYGFASQATTVVLPSTTPKGGLPNLIDRLGAVVAERTGGISEADLRSELMAAGIYTMSPRTLLGYRVLAAVAFPAIVLALGGFSFIVVVLALLFAAAGWMLPLLLVRRRAQIRLHEIELRLPDLIDLLVVIVEAGLGFSAALRLAAQQLSGPLSDELRLTLQEQTMGLASSEALANLVARSDTPGMRSFVRALAQGDRLGISTGQIMRNLAVDMRKQRRKQAEERAQKAPIKMLFPLVFLIFPALFVVLLVPAMIGLLGTL